MDGHTALPRDSSGTLSMQVILVISGRCRKMYQFLLSKVGGLNLTQAVVAAVLEETAPRDATDHHSAMNGVPW